MKALRDPDRLLTQGLAQIREEFSVPAGFPPEVTEAATAAVARAGAPPPGEYTDRTARPFVTLDPAGAVDLDQAFCIEAAGADWLLHYAIADIGAFVRDGDVIDREAWARGETTYLPDGKASLYPPVLSEGAASLLPDGDRRAVVLTVRVDPAGAVQLDTVERAVIRSRAKLAYETVRDTDLPDGFAPLAARLAAAEQARGAARVDPPEQQVESNGRGGFALAFRPALPAEQRNAALSLAANMAVARAMMDARTGLFRTMPEPDARAQERLRATAPALHIDWPAGQSLDQIEATLDPAKPPHAAFMMAIRRAAPGAGYKPFDPAEPPWHAAVAAPYAHATAPLRRLADRFVLEAVLAIAGGRPMPPGIEEAFTRLPAVMSRAAARDGRIEREVINLAETAMMANLEGCRFHATVTDVRGDKASLHLRDLPVISTMLAPEVFPGDDVEVILTHADPVHRTLTFTPA
ncbi:RNB domain-containing ribonuclease [Novosphingobium colocasiae]|uniref:Ribonuclease R n=1 Tax=Novosphingobium colocasiae TaxID=1256513 RepID=A0A918UE00_9SPHN|nr:RNB domain-containing ribonuclease [Novosphingobium colocasiae]GGY94417.1 ribonuclease R [Novosphingobium colocasiae]